MSQVLAPVGGGSNNGEVIGLANGSYMAVWTHLVTFLFPIPNVDDEQFTAVLGRVFNADGAPAGPVFQVNQSTENSGQGQPDITQLSNGNVVVVWTDGPSLGPTVGEVEAYGRILSPTGVPVTDEFLLATVTEKDQRIPQVVANDKGGFFASWSDGRDPYSNTREQWIGQEFDASGNRLGKEMWLRDGDNSEDSELMFLGDDNYFLSANEGAVFIADERFDYLPSANLEASTNFTASVPGPGNFRSDAVHDGNGTVATVAPVNASFVGVEFSTPFAGRNNTTGSFPDGTPFRSQLITMTRDPDAVESSKLLSWDIDGDFGPFGPSSALTASVAATFLPDGNLAVVWTGVTGGTNNAPVFSVLAQILSTEGVTLSDVQVIEDSNVVGGSIYPPFVSAGADGRLFIGWTGTTDRNGAGTNEIKGGVYTIPTFAEGSTNAAGVFGSSGNDSIGADAANQNETFFLFDGDDVWTQNGVASGEVYFMAGADRAVIDDAVQALGIQFQPGSGRDIFDMSASSTAHTGSVSPLVDLVGNRGTFEIVIGSPFGDELRAPNYSWIDESQVDGTRVPILHAEAGDDTIRFGGFEGGIVDGGAGFDVMTTFESRERFALSFEGDHYTLGRLTTPFGETEPRTQGASVMELRGVEEIRFGDETVSLMQTDSLPSGGVGSTGGPLPPPEPEPEDGPTEGADDLTGTPGPDTIDLLGGNDTYAGLAGNDDITGGAGADSITAGAGNDTVTGGDGPDLVFLNQGNDVFFDNPQAGPLGNDTVWGGLGDDTIQGGNGADEFRGEDGNDLINGRLGNDLIFGGTGFDTISSGDGADTVHGGDGRDLVFLNQGNDIFFDTGQGGELGRDTVWGGFGNDTIQGGNGDDLFYGEDGNDLINGRLGADLIFGGTGFDTISAGDGADTVHGGDGRDLVFLNQGNDLFIDTGQAGPLGNDTVWTGLGDDTVQGGNGADVFYGEAGNDVIFGRLGNDTVFGGSNFDVIDTGAGDDLAFGGLGRDTVVLGDGNDRFVDTDQTGTLGQDTITGGLGEDVFVFGAAPSADTITDFQTGSDLLELAGALAAGRSAAQIAADGQVTAEGVLLDFGGGNSILLAGLTATTGLEGDILIV